MYAPPQPPPAERASTFGALRHGEFQLLFAGLIFSNLGNWMQQFALGWLVVQLAVRDGNPALGGFYLGLRSLASAAPALLFGLFAGVVADRTDRRDLLIWTRIASAVVAAALAVIVIADVATIWNVMALSAVAAAAFSFDPPSRQAMLPDVVPVRDLFSAMGLTRASMQAAHTTGPLIAGLLLLPIGVGGVILVKSALFIASVGALIPMKRRPAHPSARERTMLGSLGDGLVYMRRNELIRWSTAMLIVFAVLGQSFMQLLPAFAVDWMHVGALELSWMVAANGVGALGGAFVVAGIGNVERRGPLMLGTMLSVGALLAILGLQRDVVPTLVILAVAGAVQQVFIGTQSVTLQLAAPDQLRGRVMGMQSMIFMSAGPLGVLALGSLGSVIGIGTAILIGGVAVMLMACFVMLRVPVISRLRGNELLIATSLAEPEEGAAS